MHDDDKKPKKPKGMRPPLPAVPDVGPPAIESSFLISFDTGEDGAADVVDVVRVDT